MTRFRFKITKQGGSKGLGQKSHSTPSRQGRFIANSHLC